ncbi:MAG: GNAT family N-acetyltransferase [Nanoarchaeota archaeon]|nr:GNAT family N-acetyltransferase [Nanoarchaeota archaeon]
MIETLKKQVKWRKDRKAFFVRDCKRSIDLKLALEHKPFLKKLSCGVNENELNEVEKAIFLEFKKVGFLTSLEIRNIPFRDFYLAMKILDEELGAKRVRDSEFLKEKFKEFPEFFIGIYLDNELIGVICGFPRDGYLLISEIAVDCRFQRRKFGEMLMGKFEEIGFEKYDKINVGALDSSIEFYKSLDYKPFLLIQFEKEVYGREDFSDFEILRFCQRSVEIGIKDCSLRELNRLRKIYSKASLQYIFTKGK